MAKQFQTLNLAIQIDPEGVEHIQAQHKAGVSGALPIDEYARESLRSDAEVMVFSRFGETAEKVRIVMCHDELIGTWRRPSDAEIFELIAQGAGTAEGLAEIMFFKFSAIFGVYWDDQEVQDAGASSGVYAVPLI